MEIFGSEWAAAWKAAIDDDPAYAEAGRGWVGGVVLRMPASAETPDRALHLDLNDGVCRAIRVATAADLAEAPWVISAPVSIWRDVLAGRVDPILGLLQGKLRLDRGNLLRLVPYARAAKVLLGAATRVPGAFPGYAP